MLDDLGAIGLHQRSREVEPSCLQMGSGEMFIKRNFLGKQTGRIILYLKKQTEN